MYKTAAGEYALWFLVILAFGKILAYQPVDRDRRLRRDLRPVAVHRRHLRLRLRRHRRPPVRRRGGAAGAVRGRRDGRGVHLRRPRPADLAGQRGGDDRRLLPDPAGHARGRDRLHRLPGAVTTARSTPPSCCAAAPTSTVPPRGAPLADLKITDVMRPFRPALPGPAGRHRTRRARRLPGRQRQHAGTGRRPRAGHLPARPAGPVRLRVTQPGAAPAGGLRARRAASAVPGRAARRRLGHRRERAARPRPADHGQPGRCHPTRRPPPTRSTTTRRPCSSTRRPRCPATRSSRSPYPGTRRPQDGS